MGISMAVSPSTNTVTVSKSMITNASFRTKKLPGTSSLCIEMALSSNFDLFSIPLFYTSKVHFQPNINVLKYIR